MMKRVADDGSFKPFEPVPAGRTTLLISNTKFLPAVNPHIVTFDLEDSEGRSMKAKFDNEKKTAKGAYAQRFFLNKMLDALDIPAEYGASHLDGVFVDAEVTHSVIDKKDLETGDPVFEADGVTPVKMTFANLGKVYGRGEPFAAKGTNLSEDLDAALGI